MDGLMVGCPVDDERMVGEIIGWMVDSGYLG